MTIAALLDACENRPFFSEGWLNKRWVNLEMEKHDSFADALEWALMYPDIDVRIVCATGATVWRSPPRRSDSAP